MTNHSIKFFDTQFQRQLREQDFALNPFEHLALPYLHDKVLDLGCGVGNLAIAAARQACTVTALDGSSSAIDHLRDVALAESLPIDASVADLSSYDITETYDVIVSIGLLMFLDSTQAHSLLRQIQERVRPGGYAILNVLIVGTSYLDMFEAGHYTLFGREALQEAFAGWELIASQYDDFEAPGHTTKSFITIVARKS